MLWKKKGYRMFIRTWTLRQRYCYDQPYFIQVFSMTLPHRLLPLLTFSLLYYSSVSASLLGHVFYSTDLMSAMYFLIPISWYISIVTNFIWPYLHQFFNNSHGLNGYWKPLKRPFDWYQSCFEEINIGRAIEQISR